MSDSQEMNTRNTQFPWELGVFDVHCHPTDTMSSIDDIVNMKARTLTVMATRGEDQELVSQVASRFMNDNKTEFSAELPAKTIIPCFGWHPWFSHQILDDSQHDQTTPLDKQKHYESVLVPSIRDEGFLRNLPEPRPLSTLLSETRTRLQKHPYALVGEIGLDRAFRIPSAWDTEKVENRDPSLTPGSREGRSLSPYRVQPNHQKFLLEAQLRLAGELQRPVSIHSVQSHGAVFDLLQKLWSGYEKPVSSKRQRKRRASVSQAHEESDNEIDQDEFQKKNPSPRPFPPRICMHSYSGPPEPLKQFLNPKAPADVYFSFSGAINFSSDSTDKVTQVIRLLPDDRILSESDLHCAGQIMDNLLEEIVRRICDIRGWTLEDGVRRLGNNYKKFVFG